ncbi:Ig-like domain-containing protein [Geitlerinema sp. PCC 7407]|uniref:Ig-like domain-containing protein n=1 Tax=Geitlerinema sp. PCC 7407 TaxID=1173025 RepID=UPI00029F8537|nr:Ig-like domain-containing protein [Geitlerinema sp. PCC 7407]AFY65092.1 hypothetical protein GEI7407_0594 [Geitlerinema sp. PCC 7407]
MKRGTGSFRWPSEGLWLGVLSAAIAAVMAPAASAQSSAPAPETPEALTEGAEEISAPDSRLRPLADEPPVLPSEELEAAPTSSEAEAELAPEIAPEIAPEGLGETAAPATQVGPAIAPGEVRILTPDSGSVTTAKTSVVVEFHAGDRVLVTLNGRPLDPDLPTQTSTDSDRSLVTQIWYSVPLQAGENVLSARVDGGQTSTVTLTLEEPEIQISLEAEDEGRIMADGRSALTLRGSLLDAQGNPLTQTSTVTLTSTAGQFLGADADEDRPGFQAIARDGQFTARLQSTTNAQKVQVRAAVDRDEVFGKGDRTTLEPLPIDLGPQENPLETFTQVEFVTNLRPSIATGVVNLRIGEAGTNYWGSLREFLDPDIIDDGTEVDLDAAAFATGRVGEWLFTGAYNSSRALNETCDGNRLYQDVQFCEQDYPVYGDSSTVQKTTPSRDSLFLRFERSSPEAGAEADYGMWGDYDTFEFARASQQFTATTRQLHGFKGNYSLGNFQLSAFFSNDVEGFQRDTLVPNGTSGDYFLARRLVIPGSEVVFLEAEEINRPGTVLERKQLLRGPDYEIDYDRGTLRFRRPVLATELNPFGTTLVRRLVVTYQYDSDRDTTNLYAGRLQYNFSRTFERESWVAATYLREDQGDADFELYGADFLVPLGDNGRFVGEYAHSTNDSIFLGTVDGSAYRLEVDGNISPIVWGRAFYRSVEENFVNNATSSFTPGQTRYGGALTADVAETTRLFAEFDRETNFGIAPLVRTEFVDLFNPEPEPIPGSRLDNTLTTLRAGVQQKVGTADLSLEYVNRSREDRTGETLFDRDTSQLVSRLAVPIVDTLTFRAQNELNLGGDDDPLYPDRTTLGLDWDAYPGVTVRLAHQFFEGGLFRENAITSLDTILEHDLTENTSITGRYSLINAYNQMAGQGAVGLNHRWTIAPGLRVNLGYEHVFRDLLEPTAAGDRFLQPYATGQSAAALALAGGDTYSVGIEYTDNPKFQASARLEHRDSSDGDNTVISGAAAGKLTPALTALLRYQQADATNQLLDLLGNSKTLKLGLAYRNPRDDRFNALLRYEYRENPSTIPDTLLFENGTGSRDHLFGLEAIYAPTFRWEFYGKYALRNSKTYQARNFSNDSTISLAQLRATHRIGYRTDVAGEVRWISQPGANFDELGWALEAGYYVTPDLRVALGYSFGSVDDRDFTGYRSDGGVYLNVSFKVNELFDGFGRQRLRPERPPSEEATTAEQPTAEEEEPIVLSADVLSPPLVEAVPVRSEAEEVNHEAL